MAILKHIASRSSNYGAALEYLIFKHDELRKKPILDKNGNRIMRDEFYLDGLNCEPYSFDAACQQLNREYQKNKNKDEIKSHHYIISFDPADKDECGLTGERAQAIGLEYAKANFPGHQALVCTHMDVANEQRILRHARRLARTRGITVLCTLHDLNQALQCGDRLFLMQDGCIKYTGGGDILTPETVQEIFGARVRAAIIDGKKYLIGADDDEE